MNPWLALAIAIVSEVAGTSALKASDGFTRWAPSLVVVTGYASAFYFMSLSIKTIPVAVTYAVWSGVGIALITLVAWLIYGQVLDRGALAGIALIVAGVVVLNLFSKTAAH